MKRILLIIGIIFLGIGAMQTFKYINDYSILTQYGKGYIWGSIILLFIGLALILFSKLKMKN